MGHCHLVLLSDLYLPLLQLQELRLTAAFYVVQLCVLPGEQEWWALLLPCVLCQLLHVASLHVKTWLDQAENTILTVQLLSVCLGA